jgi:putative addiction module killer protein
MIEIRETEQYTDWFASIKDRATRVRIDVRIRRLSLGNLGVVKSVGAGVSELKIDFGPGYRVYLGTEGKEIVILLGGGYKGSQPKDIKAAQKLLKELKESE